jgi:Rps23 Pro-64 3,4-dihydroxylase Tpa1-like proline 4-hydroxylase
MFDFPFTHIVKDNFLDENLALQLSKEFLFFDDPSWLFYNNPLEHKKTINNWYNFPPTTYNFFNYLNSSTFVDQLKKEFNIENLYPDPGLHGAGWHIHGQGGKLNVHLDYNIHPKLKLQRKLNLIIYLSQDWNPSWGGNLELWSHNYDTNEPKQLEKTIDCKFNRAVIFDTTQNSWHGFAQEITCPQNIYRKSIAMYYLIDPSPDTTDRYRALYAPREDQKNNIEIQKLIQSRVI